METTFIYFLRDPVNPQKGYVGKANCPKERLSKHLNECRGRCFRRANWLNYLSARGLKPVLEILAEVPQTDWKTWERTWIQNFRDIGIDLVNGTDGGDGLDNPSPEIRKKIGEANSGEKSYLFGKPGFFTGQKHRLETLEKMSAAKTGTKQSSETISKRVAKLVGKKRTPAQCEAISAGKIAANKKKNLWPTN